MPDNTSMVNVHVTIDLPAACLKAVVSNWKKKNEKGAIERRRVDTADLLSELITRFLFEKDFEAYTADESNY